MKSGQLEVFKLSEPSSVTLDLIRVLASQAVLFGHAISFLAIYNNLQPPNLPYMQSVAVVVFFVLSGFLISYSVFSKIGKSGYSFLEYFIERFSRIYSGVLPALLFVWLVDQIHIAIAPGHYVYFNAFNIRTFTANLFMLQDLGILHAITGYKIEAFGSARPFWTVAIEWWIYMCFGWMMLVIYGNEMTTLMRRARDIIVLSILLPVPIYYLIGGNGGGLVAVWLMGFMVFIGLKFQKTAQNKVKTNLLFFILTFMSAVVRTIKINANYDMVSACAFALSLFFLLCAMQGSKKSYNGYKKKVIRFMADYSFSLYLIHYTILEFLLIWKDDCNPYALLCVMLLFSNLIAIIFAYATEMRHRRWTKWIKSYLLAYDGKVR